MMRRLLYLFLLPILSCNSSVVGGGGADTGLQLSYLNDSGEDFKELDVEVFGKAYHFSNVKNGTNTAYLSFEKSYPYHFARVITSSDTLVSQPIDFVGEQFLTEGHHTLILDIDTTAGGHRVLVFKEQGTSNTSIGDSHTRPTDVLDNLFLALNKKDWALVDQYYTSSARITDMTQAHATSASDYFRKLFAQHDIYYIYLHEQQATNNGMRAKAYTRRGNLSSEMPFCFDFVILNNRIVEQHAITCDEK